jgi:hypothetical protein
MPRQNTLPEISQSYALKLCARMEEVVSPHGAHVALTGGCLYKDGARKDADIIIYKHKNTSWGAGEKERIVQVLGEAGLFKSGYDSTDASFQFVLVGTTRSATGVRRRVDLFFMDKASY